MTIPFHEHKFEIPIATQADVNIGIATDKFVTPSVLGSAALSSKEDFATSDQGQKANSAVQPIRQSLAQNGLSGGGNLSEDLSIELSQSILDKLETLNQRIGQLERKDNFFETGSLMIITIPDKKFDGWLLCDGSEVNKADYPALYRCIKDFYGTAKDKDKFKLPDYRNYYLRGSYKDCTVGSKQDDSIKSHGHSVACGKAGMHKHDFYMHLNPSNTGHDGFYYGIWGKDNFWLSGKELNNDVYKEAGEHTHEIEIQNFGRNETRPKSIAVDYFIKT